MIRSLISAFLFATPLYAQNLTLYTNREPSLINPLVIEYNKNYDTKITAHFLSTGILERLELEGDKTPADLLLLTDGALMSEAKTRKIIKGEITHLSIRSRVIYASNERVKDTALTYEQLKEPKWKGKICIRQGTHPYNVTLVASMLNHWGEQRTENWLNGVKDNLARKPTGGDRDVARDIAAGLCDIGLGNIYYIGLMTQDEKQKEWVSKIKVINPTFDNGLTHVNYSSISLTNANRNEKAAENFIHFLKSVPAQTLLTNLNFEYPMDNTVTPTPILTQWGNLNADTLSIEKIAEQRKHALDLILKTGFDK